MESFVKADGAFAAMQSGGAHQPWTSSVAPHTSSLESIAGELYFPAAVAHFKLQPGERLWDGALALLFVAVCAAAGWVGAALL